MNQGDQRGLIVPPQPQAEAALKQAWSREHLRLHRHLLRQPSLLPQGATLLLAVSGGQDSMALLALLLGLRRLHHWDLLLWHGNHGWRQEAGTQAEELQTWCRSQQLRLQIDQCNATPASSEAMARQWRYERLEHLAMAEGCSHVVTAHTASDRAETLLLHLARGSHRRGLASLRSQRPLNSNGSSNGNNASAVVLSRPLLIFSREDTGRICHHLNLPVWLDSSNDDRRYSRNRLRHDVLPVLEQLHPGATRRLSSTAERLQQEHEHNGEWVQVALQWLNTAPEGPVERPAEQLHRNRLVSLHPVNQAAVLELWLRQHGIASGAAEPIAAMVNRLQQGRPPGHAALADGWQLRWNRSTLELIAPFTPAP